ncbi:MAG TPA: hypothetical protein VNE82_03215 [Candidatus Binataceae bacterium]|nr:hypothetical protein [Candidatus Binataceae bacterium]
MTSEQSVKTPPTGTPRFGMLAALLVATGLGVGAIEITRFPIPLAGYFVFAALWAGSAVILLRRPSLRDYALTLATIFLCLAGAEVLFFVIGRPHLHRVMQPKLIRMDHQLGYAPVAGVRVKVTEHHDDQLIYDVVYTIAADDLRELPGTNQAATCKVAFFGGSFAFGEGLNDDQTMPYYFVRASDGRYQGFNFAFGGYGPHQMLRAIETGRVERIAKRLNLVIYEAIPDHVRRAAGYDQWDRYGPRYVLEPDGAVRYTGPFHRHADKWAHLMRRCWTCRYIRAHLRWRRSPADVALFAAVVGRARDLIKQRYGARFVVVFWDNSAGSRQMVRALTQKHITVYRVSDIIPDLNTKRLKYVISPFDQHPNATADRLIGGFLARTVGGCK